MEEASRILETVLFKNHCSLVSPVIGANLAMALAHQLQISNDEKIRPWLQALNTHLADKV